MTSHLEKQSCILVLLVVGSIVGMMLSPSSAYADDPPVFITKWDSNGSDKGQFNQPQDIAVDGAGDVYVVDSGNQRIQKFDMVGSPSILVSNLNIKAGEKITITFPVTVALEQTANTIITNTAFVSSTEVITPVMASQVITVTTNGTTGRIYLPLILKNKTQE